MGDETLKKDVFNVNIGVMGHVDCGKTSLVRALSTILSTAALDKHPQSMERGITLDLGFSAFLAPANDFWKGRGYQQLQMTLVDCPGHASLIKTVLGGAQIMDFLLLVMDATKGIQIQTSECIVVGELVTEKAVVVLNKIDLIPAFERNQKLRQIKDRIIKTLKQTRFRDSPVVFVAADPSREVDSDSVALEPVGMKELVDTILQHLSFVPSRASDGPFLFAFDHCFAIKGHGTVFTGTVLHGSARIGDTVEVPEIGISRKIRGMQVYRKPVTTCCQGERVAVCVSQCPSDKIERGFLGTCGYISLSNCLIGSASKIRFYKEQCLSKTKFHITIGHSTAIATVTFFSSPFPIPNGDNHDLSFTFDHRYLYENELTETEEIKDMFVLIKTDKLLNFYPQTLFIASRLDWDTHVNRCRIAFHGQILVSMQTMPEATHIKENPDRLLHLYKIKHKHGFVERLVDDNGAIVKGLFQKEFNPAIFMKMLVNLDNGGKAMIEGKFGNSGKVRIRILEKDYKELRIGSRVDLKFYKVFSLNNENKKSSLRITQDI
eukprot:jgi/Galph1/3188/GphlegSOOS_G1858.1